MAWPIGAVSRANLDAGTGSPTTARAQLDEAVSKLNTMIAHGEPLPLAGGTMTGVVSSVVGVGGIAFQAMGGAYYQTFNPGAPVDRKYWRWWTSNAGDMQFESVNDAYTAATQRVIFSQAGGSASLGVGVVAPLEALDINGRGRFRAAAGGSGMWFDGGAAIQRAFIGMEGGDDTLFRLYSGHALGNTLLLNLVSGDVSLAATAPKLIHRTGGQNVSELALSLSGAAINRGVIKLTTRRTDGSDAVDGVSIGGLSDGGVTAALLGKTGAGNLSQVITNSDGAGQVYIVAPSGSRVAIQANVVPTFDNTYTVGASGARPSAIWAANGTIQTSDGRDKTDVEPIDPARAHRFMTLLSPITFRWLVGGRKVERVPDGVDEREVEVDEEYTDTEEVPATETVQLPVEREVLEVRGGRVVARTVTELQAVERPLGTWVDVVDERGQPVMVPSGEQREIGRGRHRKTVDVLVPRKHFVPTMTPREVTRTRRVKRIEQVPRWRDEVAPVAGGRYHAGFIAQDVRRALTEAGLDRAGQALGLWVSDNPADPDAAQSLRPDQLLPLVVAAYQHQDARIAALEARLA
jgi:hypothetical protein